MPLFSFGAFSTRAFLTSTLVCVYTYTHVWMRYVYIYVCAPARASVHIRVVVVVVGGGGCVFGQEGESALARVRAGANEIDEIRFAFL